MPSVLSAIIAFFERSIFNEVLSLSVIFVFVGLIVFCFTNVDSFLKRVTDPPVT